MIILACEGDTEVQLIKTLIEKGQLSFNDEILRDGPIKLRQLDKIGPSINSLPPNEPITIYRIGDTLKDKLSLKNFSTRSQYITEYKVCTKPECEILIIIAKKDLKKFQKSKDKPKTFCKINYHQFDAITFFQNNNMLPYIAAYKHLKTHEKDEYYLDDLINHII